jgi:hypothetical protein
MLVADKDYVVRKAPQRKFFDHLSSHLKQYVVLKNCRHAVFYDKAALLRLSIAAAHAAIGKNRCRYYVVRNASRSAFNCALCVLGRPCGAPG